MKVSKFERQQGQPTCGQRTRYQHVAGNNLYGHSKGQALGQNIPVP
jgi:hypothetical protein